LISASGQHPNGWQTSIAQEVKGLTYETHVVKIGAGDRFDPEFLKFAPRCILRAIFPVQKTITDRRPRVFSACSIDASPRTRMWQEISAASPTWRFGAGRHSGKISNKHLCTSPTYRTDWGCCPGGPTIKQAKDFMPENTTAFSATKTFKRSWSKEHHPADLGYFQSEQSGFSFALSVYLANIPDKIAKVVPSDTLR
jgi:hypothetical protein